MSAELQAGHKRDRFRLCVKRLIEIDEVGACAHPRVFARAVLPTGPISLAISAAANDISFDFAASSKSAISPASMAVDRVVVRIFGDDLAVLDLKILAKGTCMSDGRVDLVLNEFDRMTTRRSSWRRTRLQPVAFGNDGSNSARTALIASFLIVSTSPASTSCCRFLTACSAFLAASGSSMPSNAASPRQTAQPKEIAETKASPFSRVVVASVAG